MCLSIYSSVHTYTYRCVCVCVRMCIFFKNDILNSTHFNFTFHSVRTMDLRFSVGKSGKQNNQTTEREFDEDKSRMAFRFFFMTDFQKHIFLLVHPGRYVRANAHVFPLAEETSRKLLTTQVPWVLTRELILGTCLFASSGFFLYMGSNWKPHSRSVSCC